jgi:hypothetical protein
MKELTLKTINNPKSPSKPFEIRMPLDDGHMYCTCPVGQMAAGPASHCEHLQALNSAVDAAMR